jgi:N-acetylglucosamine malate deacetylase 2
MKRLLVVLAHPDDEAFGPGGVLAKYGQDPSVEIHLLCATKGESGEMSEEVQSSKFKVQNKGKIGLHDIREQELLNSAKILGIKKVEFMGFKDGTLCNNLYHDITDKIIAKINDFKPQVLLTAERLGVSGHIDHIVMSMTTTYAYKKTSIPKKLYYHCMPKGFWHKFMDDYFVYFPEGYSEEEITTRIDYGSVVDIKKQAMCEHKSQMKDVKRLLFYMKFRKKIDHFILQFHRGVRVKLPETDLFEGI